MDDIFDDCFSEPDKKAYADENGDLMGPASPRPSRRHRGLARRRHGAHDGLGFQPEDVTKPVTLDGKQDQFVSYSTPSGSPSACRTRICTSSPTKAT